MLQKPMLRLSVGAAQTTLSSRFPVSMFFSNVLATSHPVLLYLRNSLVLPRTPIHSSFPPSSPPQRQTTPLHLLPHRTTLAHALRIPPWFCLPPPSTLPFLLTLKTPPFLPLPPRTFLLCTLNTPNSSPKPRTASSTSQASPGARAKGRSPSTATIHSAKQRPTARGASWCGQCPAGLTCPPPRPTPFLSSDTPRHTFRYYHGRGLTRPLLPLYTYHFLTRQKKI